MTALPALPDLAEEYEFLDSEDRYRLLIELGRKAYRLRAVFDQPAALVMPFELDVQ